MREVVRDREGGEEDEEMIDNGLDFEMKEERCN